MDKNIFIRKSALRPTEEQRLLTKPFYQNANTIYQHFDDWKDIDRLYFIPLYLEMTYSVAGITAELAPDPVWLGSFVQTIRSHPDLFQFKCPDCGKPVLPYRFVGSPLSGWVDLEGYCACGWKGYQTVSGWFVRGEALRKQMAADTLRYHKFRILHPGTRPATFEELLGNLDR